MGIFLEDFLGRFLFDGIFLVGIFWEKTFGRMFLGGLFWGGIFWEDFWEDFLGGLFGRISTEIYLNIEGIDLFAKILVFVKILYLRKGRKEEGRKI